MADDFWIPILYNSRPMKWHGVWITDRVDHLPTYAVTVDAQVGTGDTVGDALLHAARRADAVAKANEIRGEES